MRQIKFPRDVPIQKWMEFVEIVISRLCRRAKKTV